MGSEVKKSGLTTKVFVIGLLICVFGSWSFGAAWEKSGADFRWWGDQSDYPFTYSTADTAFAAFGGALFLVGILALINRVKPLFTKQEMVILLIITLVSCVPQWPLVTSGGINAEYNYPWNWVAADEIRREPYLEQFGGTFLCPEPFTDYDYAFSVADGSLAAGNAMPVNWGAWAPLFGYMTGSMLAFALIGVAIAMLVQRLYIDIESIEFPWGEMNLVGLDQVNSWVSKSAEGLKSKWFLIGFAPFFILHTLQWAPNNVSWLLTGSQWSQWMDGFLDVPGLPTTRGSGPLGIWEYNVTQLGLSILPWVGMTIFWLPHIYGGLYLIPLDTLFGGTLGAVVGGILLPILYTNLGYIGRWGPQELKRTLRNGLHRANNGFAMWLAFGAILPMIILPLWTHRSTFKNILKGMFSSKASRRADPEAPMSFSYVWLMFFGGILLMILSMSYAPLLYAVPTYLLNVAEVFAEARLITAGAAFGPATYATYDINTVQAPAMMGETIWDIITRWYYIGYVSENNPIVNWYWLHYVNRLGTAMHGGEKCYIIIMSMAIGLAAFYLAKRTNIRKKDIFITLLVFLPLAMIFTNIFRILVVHWADVMPPPGGYSSAQGFSAEVGFASRAQTGANYSWPIEEVAMTWWGWKIGGMVLGIALTTAMYAMRSRFARFRIEPAGFVFGLAFPGLIPAIFIATLLKYMTMRIGGAEFYQKVGKPLAVGTLFAWGGSYFIHHGIQWLWIWRTAFGIWPF